MRMRALVLVLVMLAAAAGVACQGKTTVAANGTACLTAADCSCSKNLTWAKLASEPGATSVRWVLTEPTCNGTRRRVMDEVTCDSTGGMDPTCGYEIDSMIVVGRASGT